MMKFQLNSFQAILIKTRSKLTKRVLMTILLAMQLAVFEAHADWFQLYRADHGAYIAHAKVEIQNPAGTVKYTDFFGRFEVALPPGSYDAIVTQSGWRSQFHISVDGSTEIKVYRLQ